MANFTFTQHELTEDLRRRLLRKAKLSYQRRGQRRGFIFWAEKYQPGYLPADTVPHLRISLEQKQALCQHLEQYDHQTSFVLLRMTTAAAVLIETWSATEQLNVEVETDGTRQPQPADAAP